MGLAGYYRKFIRHFASIAAPLNQLLTKDGFQWHEAAEEAFQRLKQALTTTPVLNLPDFIQCFEIECDACGIGIGAMLTQNNRPIAYFSEALKESSLSTSTYKKEMLAIVKSVKKWRPYLAWKALYCAYRSQKLEIPLRAAHHYSDSD